MALSFEIGQLIGTVLSCDRNRTQFRVAVSHSRVGHKLKEAVF